jgi:MinD-like ATPase involved in chromosome partitioning or flagellar assembly
MGPISRRDLIAREQAAIGHLTAGQRDPGGAPLGAPSGASHPGLAPAADPWSSPAPAGPVGAGPEGAGPFESDAEQRRRRLRSRPGEPWLVRTARAAKGLVSADDYPQRLVAATAGAQAAVSTGRRIAVIGSRGGAGKTTTAALLASLYAAARQDTISAVDLAPAGGTLALRLGVPDAPAIDQAAAALQHVPAASAEDLRRQLAAAAANLWVAGERALGGHAGAAGLAAAGQSISRYCPVAVYDCATGPGENPDTNWAIGAAHVAVLVAPASVAGIQDVRRTAAAWAATPELAGTGLLAVLTQTDAGAPLDPMSEAKALARDGLVVLPLGYDRHLASGVEFEPGLMSRAVRLQAAELASTALALAMEHTGR